MSSIGNKAIFAKNLKYYIGQSGKDRRQLAEIWGFPYSTVTEWINARKYPRIDRVEVIANYFGIQMSDLIEEKLTDQKEKDNDTLSSIIVRMRTDPRFFDVVESIYNLEPSKIDGVSQMLKTLEAFAK